MTPIKHPLTLGTTVRATKPSCACRGAKMINVGGKVLKVITNHSGTWYYLDSGTTVKADMITSIVS
jgi:hypothetical protein